MFKKSRRNFRRRNDSEEEEREDGVGQESVQIGPAAEAPLTNNNHEKGAEPPPPPPIPPPTPQIGGVCEAGAVPVLLARPGIGLLGPLGPVNTLPAAPAPLKAGPALAPPKAASGLGLGKAGPCIATAKLAPKDKKRSREKEAPRAALLSFQDEEE
eukprot:g36597.t1